MSTANKDFTEPSFSQKGQSPSIFSQLTFTYLTPLLRLAHKQTLSADDLSRLPMSTDHEPHQLATRLNHFFHVYGPDNVLKSLLMFLAPYYVLTVLTEALANAIVGRRAHLLADYNSSYERLYLSTSPTDQMSLIFASLKIAFVSMMPPLIKGFSYFKLFELAGKLRMAVTGIIADRLLSASIGPLRLFHDQMMSTGKLVNIVSVDLQELSEGAVTMSPFLVMPLTIYQACLTVLGSEIVMECTVGLIVALGYVVLQSVLMFLIKRQLTDVKKKSDARIRLTHDLIRQQRSIKQLGYLQKFTEQIQALRHNEVISIRFHLLLMTMSECLHMLVTPITQTAILYTMSLNGALTLSRMVVVNELVTITMRNLFMYVPHVVRSVPTVSVSMGRLAEFLRATFSRSSTVSAATGQVSGIKCDQVRFEIDSKTCTSPLSLNLLQGQRCIVTGSSGSGKSTILDGLTECLPSVTGSLAYSTQSAYFTQMPCIFKGTIRDNIVMGRLFDRLLFERCLDECDLKDVDAERQCGVEGKELSGGQKQRVALARVAYGQPEMCVLDDPFSGLDQKCAKTIMNKLFADGLLSKSTLILATSCPESLCLRYDAMVTVDKSKPIAVSYGLVEPSPTDILPQIIQADKQRAGIQSGNNQQTQDSTDTFDLKRVLSRYFTMSGGILAFLAIFAAFAMEQYVKRRQSATILSVFSAPQSQGEGNNMDMQPYLVMSVLMAVSKIIYSVLITLCHSSAAQKLHHMFVRCLSKSDKVASEQNSKALGMASRDMQIVDVELFSTVQALIGMVSVVVGAVSVVLFCDLKDEAEKTRAVLISLVLLVCLSGGAVFHFYNQAWRQARRLLSVYNANLIERVVEAATGLVQLHSLPQQSRNTYRDRLYTDIATLGRAQQFHQSVRRFATLYLEVLPIVARLLCDSVSVLLRLKPAVRVVFGDAMNTTAEAFEMLSKNLSMVDSALLSYDMMLEVCEECEESACLYSDDQLRVQPQQKALEFSNISVSINKLPILKSVSFTINQGERVAIIGRTGAGKSSLFNCLFNTLPESAQKTGTLSVFGRDVSKYTGTLQNLVIIPQDPCLVSGSVRFNMDPLRAYADKVIASNLARVGLKLDLNADLDGINLSAAEKQCLALARAVMNCRDGSILLVDEVAARTDMKVLELMTSVIMELPRTVTVIAIMHRIAGSFDRVLEMSSGQLVSDSNSQ